MDIVDIKRRFARPTICLLMTHCINASYNTLLYYSYLQYITNFVKNLDKKNTSPLLYDIHLYGLNLNALLDKEVYHLVHVTALPFEFKGHKPYLVGDRGLTYVGNDVKPFSCLVYEG